ncbi:MAG: RNA polymerase sigma factor [Fimbriimonadales bacterium]
MQNRLLQAIREGDLEALDQLIQHYRPALARYLRSRARSEQDAEDILQEALLRASRALPSTELHMPVDHWLFRIASNCLRTYYERTYPRAEVTFSQLEHPETLSNLQQESPEPSLLEQIADEQTEAQLAAIARTVCSPPERQVLMLMIQDGRLEMVARMLDMNPSTARTYLMRARSKVLAHIVQHCPEMVGGKEAIQKAIAHLQKNAPPKERLTDKEIQAIQQPGRNQEVLRKACLKLAKYLKLQ